MTNKKDSKDFEKFMSKVDDIQSLVKDLSTSTVETHDDAVRKADEYIQKLEPEKCYKSRDNTGVNRTVINDDAFKNWNNNSQTGAGSGPKFEDASPEAFMLAMEEDCQERAQRRREREADATVLKDKGNKEFGEGNYMAAIELYTEALGKVRYWTTLYTNRAQCHLRLADYKATLDDCTEAFRIDEQCIKAYVLQGKAYLALKEYNKAHDSYQQVANIDPKKKKVPTDYQNEAKISRESESQESAVKAAFSKYAGLVDLFEKVNKPGQLPIYYHGGLGIIKTHLTDVNEKTLFRTCGGLALTKTHQSISKCFASSPASLSREEALMCGVYIDVLQTACHGNVKNQVDLLENPELPSQLLAFMESTSKHCAAAITDSAIQLLLLLSETEHVRTDVVKKFNIPRLNAVIFAALRTSSDMRALNAVRLFSNLALEKKFKSDIGNDMETSLLPLFASTLSQEGVNQSSLQFVMSTMANLCTDARIRFKMAASRPAWAECTATLERHVCRLVSTQSADIVVATLGLLLNMALNGVSRDVVDVALANQIVRLSARAVNQIERAELTERALLLVSRVVNAAADESAIAELCQNQFLVQCLQLIQRGEPKITKPAMACLTALTQSSTDAVSQIVDYPKGLKTVVTLLKESDDVVVGNAALCLSHCAVVAKVSKVLVKTEIIMDLLVLARDQAKPTVQHNCAICIAKLAQTDQRHLSRLRELHGLEILDTVLRHVKS